MFYFWLSWSNKFNNVIRLRWASTRNVSFLMFCCGDKWFYWLTHLIKWCFVFQLRRACNSYRRFQAAFPSFPLTACQRTDFLRVLQPSWSARVILFGQFSNDVPAVDEQEDSKASLFALTTCRSAAETSFWSCANPPDKRVKVPKNRISKSCRWDRWK